MPIVPSDRSGIRKTILVPTTMPRMNWNPALLIAINEMAVNAVTELAARKYLDRLQDGWGKTFIVACLYNRDRNLLDPIHYPAWKYLCTIITHPYLFEHLL